MIFVIYCGVRLSRISRKLRRTRRIHSSMDIYSFTCFSISRMRFWELVMLSGDLIDLLEFRSRSISIGSIIQKPEMQTCGDISKTFRRRCTIEKGIQNLLLRSMLIQFASWLILTRV